MAKSLINSRNEKYIMQIKNYSWSPRSSIDSEDFNGPKVELFDRLIFKKTKVLFGVQKIEGLKNLLTCTKRVTEKILVIFLHLIGESCL